MVLMECRGIDSPQRTGRKAPHSGDMLDRHALGAGHRCRRPAYSMWSLDANNAADGICTQQYVQRAHTVAVQLRRRASPGPTSGCRSTPPTGPTTRSGRRAAPAPPRRCSPRDEDPTIIPSDTTYAETTLNGTGSAKFTIMTSETNASLGCSQTVACSLVIIPIEGINCNANPQVGSPSYECESLGTFPPGSLNVGSNPYPPAQAVTGTYWWSGSNWDRRISVPLSFATPANACANNTQAPLDFYGSEVMAAGGRAVGPGFLPQPQAVQRQRGPAARTGRQELPAAGVHRGCHPR